MPITLPTAPTLPKRKMESLTLLIFGAPKIGKSTLASHADGAVFWAFEPGLNSLTTHQVPITSWEETLEMAAALRDQQHAFKTNVWDTADNAFRYCGEWICRQNNITHLDDLKDKKGYTLCNNEFRRVVTKVAASSMGLVLISHSKTEKVKTRTGERDKVLPTLTGGARGILLGMSDAILYCDVEEGTDEAGLPCINRVLRTKPSLDYEAGDRTGLLPETLPMDWAALVAAMTGTAPAMAAPPAKTPDIPAAQTAPTPEPANTTAPAATTQKDK